jgi:hypothetical protein
VATTTTEATLPTWEELEAFWNRASNFVDALNSEIAWRVFRVTNREDEQTVTLEQIGALLMFVSWMDDQATELRETLDKIKQATYIDLDTIRREGRMANAPSFTEYGTTPPPITARELAELLREADDA